MVLIGNTDINLNVKIHLLEFSEESVYNSLIKDRQINELFERVNAVWRCAGIRWKLLPVHRLLLDQQEDMKLSEISKKFELRKVFEKMSPTIPPVFSGRIWNVCFLNRFPIRAGGVYLSTTKTVFFAETSKWNEPNAITLAHELGHMLGLNHSQIEGNLMNLQSLPCLHNNLKSNQTFTKQSLTTEQIDVARKQTQIGPC